MTEYYYTFSTYLKEKYGEKVRKISLDAGFSCPNCDPDGREGCIYCRNDSFSRQASLLNKSISEQMAEGIKYASGRLNINMYVAYFQASSNTFAPVSLLKKYYEEAIAFDNVVGISIATRPDCLPPKVLDLIQQLTQRIDVWIELGLQSAHNKTLALINRGHTVEEYLAAVKKLQKLNVRICTHLMLGLPGEGPPEVNQTAEQLALSGIDEVKLHPVLILRNTKLESLYQQKTFQALSLREYATMAVDVIERLPARMVIQRLTAEAPESMLVAPAWSHKKSAVINAIKNEFKDRNSYQGLLFKGDGGDQRVIFSY